MKHHQTLRRGLGVLLALLLCLSLLPATALAAETQMTTGDIVAENQPFQVYLGDKPVSTVIVKYPINGEAQSFHWSKSEQTGQDWAIQNNYLTVGGKYVSAGGNDSLVGMTLTGVEFDYLEIKYDNGPLRGSFLFRWDSVANKYEYESNTNIGAVSHANVIINGENGSFSFQLVDDSNIYNGGFNPDEARRTVLTFENRSKLPSTPLEAGKTYNHYLSSSNIWVINPPLYAVGHGTNDCYQVYEGSEVGLTITGPSGQNTAIANLTVSENSPLVGATFTGEVYNASMATFTGSDGSTRDLLIYEYSYNPDADGINYYSYKCIVYGKIVDLKNAFSSDNWFTLTFEENGVRYEATSPEQYYVCYIMTNRVLFFNTADSPTTTYTVTFDANGGSGEMTAVTVVPGSYTLPECGFTAPESKQFKGWATSADGTVITDDTITVTDNTTLYAIWKDIPATTSVAINAANFPDETFRAYVSRNFDTDKDGSLSAEEIAAVTEIYCYQMGIASLKGVEHFTALEYLYCYGNELTSLDISKNTALEELYCYGNQLTALDVSNNTALKYLYCGWNQLTALDVSKNTALKKLYCNGNYLTSLDLSKNTALTDLHCVDNSYDITLDANGTFDLSTLPGNFDISKASNWNGGTVEGNTLTVNADATTVTYDYDCGNGKSAFFTLDATPKYTVTANGIYNEHYGNAPGETFTLDYAAGADVALPIGKRDGYTLKDLTLVGITEKDLTWSAEGVEDEDRGIFFTMPENDVTITVNWTKNGSGSSSSSSGGGFSGTYNYPVRADSTDIHGAAVTLDKTSAVAGDKVTITVTPDSGKAVDQVIVTDADGKTITVTKAGDNQYTFTMPAGKVNIAVTTKAADYQKQIVLQIGNRNILENNRTITNDVAPVIVDNRTMVPIRVITETLGGTAYWNADTRTVTLNIDGKTLTMTIGQTISGFDVAPIILNDRTYVPVRYVAEMLGASVEWDGTTQQIIITK